MLRIIPGVSSSRGGYAKLTPKGDDFDADGDSGSEDDPETGGEPALSVLASAAPDLPSVTTL